MATRVTTTIEVPSISSLRDVRARRALPALVDTYRELQERIADLQADEAYQQIRNQVEELEASKKSLMSEIVGHADRAEIGKVGVTGPGWRLSRVTTPRSSIKPELLLNQGVDMDVIEAATVETSTHYYKVTRQDD